jgi:hypothetical protein
MSDTCPLESRDAKPSNPRKVVRGALRFEHCISQLESFAVGALRDLAGSRYILDRHCVSST